MRKFIQCIVLIQIVSAAFPNIVVVMPDDMQFLWPEAPNPVEDASFQPPTTSIPNFQKIRDQGAIVPVP